VGAPGPAANEHYADDPADGGQSAGESNELVLSDHSCSMPLGEARNSRRRELRARALVIRLGGFLADYAAVNRPAPLVEALAGLRRAAVAR